MFEEIEKSIYKSSVNLIEQYHLSEKINEVSILHHYTNSVGLMGIVSGQELWFSDARCLNDGSELIVGLSIIKDCLIEYGEKTKKFDSNTALHIHTYVINSVSSLLPVVFCMSEGSNILNQWRDYGKDTVSYSISINVKSLISSNLNFKPILIKVIYDFDKIKSMCMQLINTIFDAFDNYKFTEFTSKNAHQVLVHAGFELAWLSLNFKHPAFEAEREWRLLGFRNETQNINEIKAFRASSFGVIPVYKLKKLDGNKLDIVKVTIGPCNHFDVTRLGLREFLSDNGYDIEIQPAQIPLRR